MEFFLEMVLSAIVSLLFSFVVAKLVSVTMVGTSGGGGPGESEEKSKNFVGEEAIMEELQFEQRMDAPVFESERNVGVVEESVEYVDRFGGEHARVKLEEAAKDSGEIGDKREVSPVQSAETESGAAESPKNTTVEVMVVRVEEKQSESVEERSDCVEIGERSEPQESGDIAVPESEEVRVEDIESKAVNEENTEALDIEEEDDDWEGVERSELEKAFAAAANFVEESGEAIGIGTEAKLELYGLHKVATEGSCREPQPMALMLSARAKWNAWQKLGHMSQEEAMERYLALLSKEIPAWMRDTSIGEKTPETKTSVILPPDSASRNQEGDRNDTSSLDSKAKGDSAV